MHKPPGMYDELLKRVTVESVLLIVIGSHMLCTSNSYARIRYAYATHTVITLHWRTFVDTSSFKHSRVMRISMFFSYSREKVVLIELIWSAVGTHLKSVSYKSLSIIRTRFKAQITINSQENIANSTVMNRGRWDEPHTRLSPYKRAVQMPFRIINWDVYPSPILFIN